MSGPVVDQIPIDRPTFPDCYRPGVAIVGCGAIVTEAHLPVYQKSGIPVIGLFDASKAAAEAVGCRFSVGRIYRSLDELLGDPSVAVVDIATHPDVRPELILRALDAGKHVLAQKPLARDMRDAQRVVAASASSGYKVAINQNGRWAPPWMVANQLLHAGAIGEVLSITQLQNTNFSYVAGTRFDEDRHFTILDFSIHWIDIIRCWMSNIPVGRIRARQYRVPGQPSDAQTPWGMWIEIEYVNGASALVRGTGMAQPETQGHPFWIHGTAGTVRGSVRHQEFLQLESKEGVVRFEMDGEWYFDGFAGALAELLTAIVEDRQPSNSAADNLLTLQMTLAACASADADGLPMSL